MASEVGVDGELLNFTMYSTHTQSLQERETPSPKVDSNKKKIPSSTKGGWSLNMLVPIQDHIATIHKSATSLKNVKRKSK